MATRVHMEVPYEGDDWIAQILDLMAVSYDPPYNQGHPAKVNYTSYLLSLLLDNWGGGGSGGGTFWALAGNNTSATQKLGTTSDQNVHITTNNLTRGTWKKTGEFVWGGSEAVTPLGLFHIRGTTHSSSTSSFHVENNDASHSLNWRDDGAILRNGTLYSIPKGIDTSWGVSALAGLTSATGATAIGNAAGNSMVSNSITAVGYFALSGATAAGNSALGHAAGSRLTTGTDNTFIGFQADYNATDATPSCTTGYYNIALGSCSLIGGAAFNNVLSIHAQGTASEQIVFGGFTEPYNANVSKYSNMFVGRGVTNTVAALGSFNMQATGVNSGVTNGSAATSVFYITGAAGTSQGVGGAIIFRTCQAAVGSGSTPNTPSDRFTIEENGNIGMNATSYGSGVKVFSLGDAATDPTTAPTASSVIYSSSTQGALGYFRKQNHFIESCLFTQTNSVNIANSAVESSILGTGIGSATIKANFWTIGKTIRIHGMGAISIISTPTFRIRVTVGGATILDSTAIATTATTALSAYVFEAIITCRTTGASATFAAQGLFHYVKTVPNATGDFTLTNNNTVSWDSTVDKAFDILITWGTANASNSITSTNLIIETAN